MDDQQVLSQLKAAPLFSRVPEKGLKAILRSATEKRFEAGERIVSEGDSGTGFYLILSGRAEVTRGSEKLATLGAGTFFGEMALLDGAPRSADVTTVEDTSCLVLTPWTMRSVVSANPDVSLAMLEELTRRLRETERSLS
jgi:CRP-like cAMP-binding protein